MKTVVTNWFRHRSAAMLAEIPLQRNRAHADVEVTRKLNSGEYLIGAGPSQVPGEVERRWTDDGRLEIVVQESPVE